MIKDYKIKQNLYEFIKGEIQDRAWTNKQASLELGLDESKISRIVNKNLSRISICYMVKVCYQLGYDVSVNIEARL